MGVLGMISLASVAAIPTVTLEGNVVLPMVALGTGSGQKGNVTQATMLWLQAGGTAIDTAYNYMDESDIAKGLAAAGAKREDVFLQTKIPCGTAEGAAKKIDSDLSQLGVKQVDLLLLHYPTCVLGSVKATWGALEDAFTAGKARAIGVSNFKQADFNALMAYAKTRPALVQNSFSVSHHLDDDVAFFRSQGVMYQAFSPLCGGGNGSSCPYGSVLKNPTVIQIASSRNLSAAQIGLKFVVQQGIPLTTAAWKEAYMVEDLDLWSWGNLTAGEMDQLNNAAPSL
eukprot:Hpha_TRINITY_DN8619_c0_g1::TRINITY_DN8619_c0_g1_i1::g.168826::m.168826